MQNMLYLENLYLRKISIPDAFSCFLASLPLKELSLCNCENITGAVTCKTFVLSRPLVGQWGISEELHLRKIRRAVIYCPARCRTINRVNDMREQGQQEHFLRNRY